jgi:2-polyprenyl-3-methyl-5-hydroxy-6-metoxy-1,4-benzoquinol methylase
MIKKNCPICGTRDFSHNIYKKKLPTDLTEANFAGRKDPDGYHYEMARCLKCSLLYASEIYDEEYSNKLYDESSFDYSDELSGLTKSYSSVLKESLETLNNDRNNFLEIGCGNGFVLDEALNAGFRNIKGIEPSQDAISFASNRVKKYIYHGIFDSSQIEENHYDVVFVAMIIEHVPDSNQFLDNIYKTLKPGGIIICICHDERHFLAKILKNKHPIINDEHVAVFNKKALELIFKNNKFTNIKINNLKNFYSISYWLKMMPIPKIFKRTLNNKFSKFLKRFIIGFKAGNLYLIAKKN